MKLKNIIFDFDGVIVDSYEMVYSLLHQWDKSINEKIFLSLFNKNVATSIKEKFGKQAIVSLTKFVTKNYTGKIHDVKSFVKVSEHLKILANNYNLFVISSGSEENINIFLNNNSLNYFKKILGSETAFNKIDKFMILEKEFKVSKENSIFVTDTLGDIAEAHQVGYKVLAETFGFHNKKRLEKGDPEWIVDNWDDLVETINSI